MIDTTFGVLTCLTFCACGSPAAANAQILGSKRGRVTLSRDLKNSKFARAGADINLLAPMHMQVSFYVATWHLIQSFSRFAWLCLEMPGVFNSCRERSMRMRRGQKISLDLRERIFLSL